MNQYQASDFKQAEYARTQWVIYPEHGMSDEKAIEPEMFKHIGHKFQPGDKIEFLWQDMSRYAEGIVIDCGRLFAHVFYTVKPMAIGAKSKVKVPEQYEVYWVSPTRKHGVKRISDGELMAADMTKEEAQKWAANNAKALAA